jgi:hypothetical protein
MRRAVGGNKVLREIVDVLDVLWRGYCVSVCARRCVIAGYYVSASSEVRVRVSSVVDVDVSKNYQRERKVLERVKAFNLLLLLDPLVSS